MAQTTLDAHQHVRTTILDVSLRDPSENVDSSEIVAAVDDMNRESIGAAIRNPASKLPNWDEYNTDL